MRKTKLVALALGLCLWAPPAEPVLAYAPLLLLARKATVWVLSTLSAHVASKAIDCLTGQSFIQQLEQQIPTLVDLISKATGPERDLLQDQLDVVREQLVLMSRVLDAQREDIAQLRVEQNRMILRIDDLADRMEQLEGRVDSLEGEVGALNSRVGHLEQAMIGQCLDRRYADTVGAEGFRVQGAGESLLVDQVDRPEFSLSLRLHLNACTATLTERGLLIQLSLITRGLDRDFSLYTTFKHLGTGGFDPVHMNHLQRREVLLSRPAYHLDGQVRELFVPYEEIPFPSHGDRVALAIVVTHDGGPIYTLSDRVIHCVFGQRISCRWRR